MTLKITTLIEDTKKDDSLINEFGLSMHIESKELNILLDTGTTGQFLKNTSRLGIDPKDIDIVVLSHGHFDHGGGLGAILDTNTTCKTYMHKDAPGAYYGNIGAKLPAAVNFFVHPMIKHSMKVSRYIGLDPAVLKKHTDRIQYISSTQEIAKNIFLITDISRNYAAPAGNKFLLFLENGTLKEDDFRHEMILLIKEKDGMIIFSGCCHNGILNMIETVRRQFKDQPIKAVIGGFHLKLQPMKDDMASTKNDVKNIATELVRQKVGKVFTGHCTGNKAYAVLGSVLQERLEPIFTGSSIRI